MIDPSGSKNGGVRMGDDSHIIHLIDQGSQFLSPQGHDDCALCTLSFLSKVLDRLGPVRCDLHIDLDDVWRDRVSPEVLPASNTIVFRMEAYALRDKHSLPFRSEYFPSHGEARLVAATGHHQLVAWQAHKDAIDLIFDALPNDGIGVMARDLPLVRLACLRVSNDRLEFDHSYPPELD